MVQHLLVQGKEEVMVGIPHLIHHQEIWSPQQVVEVADLTNLVVTQSVEILVDVVVEDLTIVARDQCLMALVINQHRLLFRAPLVTMETEVELVLLLIVAHLEVVEVAAALVQLVEIFLDVLVGREDHILSQQMVTQPHRPIIGSVVEVVWWITI